MKNRLNELDGLRGIAILIVMSYHYFGRFPDFYKYNFDVSEYFHYGKLGVELFFIISGFVISLTLNKNSSLIDFTMKRVFRLLPPLVACSIFTFIVMWVVDTPFTLFRRVGMVGFLPSWTFTSPALWRPFFPQAEYIDGAYWSLFVEVRFYFWAALLTFLGPIKKIDMIKKMICLFLFAYTLDFLSMSFGMTLASTALNFIFFTEYLYLFVAGVIFYDIYKNGSELWKLFFLLITFLVMPFKSEDLISSSIISMYYAAFLLLIFKREAVSFLNYRPLTFCGIISYSTYLLHQNIGVTILTMLPSGLSTSSYLCCALLVICVIFSLGWLSYFFLERKSHTFANFMMTKLHLDKIRNRAAV